MITRSLPSMATPPASIGYQNFEKVQYDPEAAADVPYGSPYHADKYQRDVYLSHEARLQHMYVVGQTGVGKSTFLLNLMRHDAEVGTGFIYIDPHGEDALRLLDYIPPHRLDDVIYFDVADAEYPIAFNVLGHIPENERHIVMYGIVAAFRNMYPDSWSESRMQYLFTNAIAALLDLEDATLLALPRLLSDSETEFRKKVKRSIRNREAERFWNEEYPSWTKSYRRDAANAILNKVNQLFLSPLLLNILGQTKSAIDLSAVMNEGKILIINLAEGRAGDGAADLIGSAFVTHIHAEVMRRAGLPKKMRLPQIHLYMDEFQDFIPSQSLSRTLSGVRKFGLGVTLAHQYMDQLDDAVRAAIFGNVGTLVSFRVGELDAHHLERAIPHPLDMGGRPLPDSQQQKLIELANYNARVKQVAHESFFIETHPLGDPIANQCDEIIDASRARYGTPRAEAEREIGERWYKNKKRFQVQFDA